MGIEEVRIKSILDTVEYFLNGNGACYPLLQCGARFIIVSVGSGFIRFRSCLAFHGVTAQNGFDCSRKRNSVR